MLAPMFLPVCGGDFRMACMAANGTLNDYRARGQSDLISIAQIIAFGLSALLALSLSMDDDVSAPIAMNLFRIASVLHRCGEASRRSLRKDQAADASPDPVKPPVVSPDPPPVIDPVPLPVSQAAEPFLSDVAAEALSAESASRLQVPAADIATIPEKRQQAMWAITMVKDASDISASMPALPESERRDAILRAGELSATANKLLTGVPSIPITPKRPDDNP
jgi:hypothetical protein